MTVASEMAQRLQETLALTYRCEVNLEGTINKMLELGLSESDTESILEDVIENVEWVASEAKDFYFQIGWFDDYEQTVCVVTPKNLWDTERVWDDQSLADAVIGGLPIFRASESIYELDSTPEIVRQKMLDAGFTENLELLDE